jgi:hypothetical protein
MITTSNSLSPAALGATLSLELFLPDRRDGIAIPVGPIAILIIELGIRRGFSVAFCAGAGAASADLVYVTLAALAGTFLVIITL